jgi:hypothetical protein
MAANFLAPLALGAGVGVVGGTVSTLATLKAAKERKARIAELEGKIASDEFGLSAQEKRLGERELLDPIRAMATQRQSQQEAAQAAAGTVSGADLSRLRTETAQGLATAGVDAGEKLQRLDIETEAREEQAARGELAALNAAKQQRTQDILGGFLGPLAPAAAASGALLGGPPEMQAGSYLDPDDLFAEIAGGEGYSDDLKASIASMSPSQRMAFARNAERARWNRMVREASGGAY